MFHITIKIYYIYKNTHLESFIFVESNYGNCMKRWMHTDVIFCIFFHPDTIYINYVTFNINTHKLASLADTVCPQSSPAGAWE